MAEIRVHRIVALDGLRGVAILLVMALHLFDFRQGWIGVDIFFVLSGYLITGILLTERTQVHFWKRFYVRRVTRIVPAFVLLLLLSAIFGALQWKLLWSYLLFFGANIAYLRFQGPMELAAVHVLWSLAVEEHFYFVWPVQVRSFSNRTLVTILVAILIAEPVVRTVAIVLGANWRVTYLLTPFRLDGLAAGALLAIAFQSAQGRVWLQAYTPRILPLLSLTMAVLFPWFIEKADILFCNIAGYALLAYFSTFVIANVLLRPEGRLARLLSVRILVFVGRISYGLYLLHAIINVVIKRAGDYVGYHHYERLRVVSVGLSILLAWLSFRYFESYVLAWGKRKVHALSEETDIIKLSGLATQDASR